METTSSFTALVRKMRQAQKTYYKDLGTPNLVAAKQAESAIDKALQVVSDIRPGISITCWYGDDGQLVAQPAAMIGLPPTASGEFVSVVLDVYKDTLDEIEPGNEELHEFILKWERYALENFLPFDVSEDFEVVDNRWQVVVEEESE
jgi:hypothetical protein